MHALERCAGGVGGDGGGAGEAIVACNARMQSVWTVEGRVGCVCLQGWLERENAHSVPVHSRV